MYKIFLIILLILPAVHAFDDPCWHQPHPDQDRDGVCDIYDECMSDKQIAVDKLGCTQQRENTITNHIQSSLIIAQEELFNSQGIVFAQQEDQEAESKLTVELSDDLLDYQDLQIEIFMGDYRVTSTAAQQVVVFEDIIPVGQEFMIRLVSQDIAYISPELQMHESFTIDIKREEENAFRLPVTFYQEDMSGQATKDGVTLFLDLPSQMDTRIKFTIIESIDGQCEVPIQYRINGQSTTGVFYNCHNDNPKTIEFPATFTQGTNEIEFLYDGESMFIDNVHIFDEVMLPLTANRGEVIEAENFNTGGQGIGYFEVDNAYSCNMYKFDRACRKRQADAVEILEKHEGGYMVGYIAPGDWVAYDIDIPAGNYFLTAEVATSNQHSPCPKTIGVHTHTSGNALHEATSVGQLVMDGCTGYQNFYEVSTKINIPEGTKKIVLESESGDYNIDSFNIKKVTNPFEGVTNPFFNLDQSMSTRDPGVFYQNGVYHIYFSLVEGSIEAEPLHAYFTFDRTVELNDEIRGPSPSDAIGQHNIEFVPSQITTNAGFYQESEVSNLALKINPGGYVTLPAEKSLNLNNKFTIQAWVKPDQINNGNQGIITKYTDFAEKQWGLSIYEDKLDFAYETNANDFSLQAGQIQAGVWQHVAVSVDNLEVKLYLNGQEVASGTAPGYVQLSDTPVIIGGLGGTYQDYKYSGLIDEIRVHSVPLSAEIIQKHAQLPALGRIWRMAHISTEDFLTFSPVTVVAEKGFISSGTNVLQEGSQLIMPMHKYDPLPHEVWASGGDERLYFMRGSSPTQWSLPEKITPPPEYADSRRAIDIALFNDGTAYHGYFKTNFAKLGHWILDSPNIQTDGWRYMSDDIMSGQHPEAENPDVIKADDTYYLWYSRNRGLHVRTSSDLINWGPEHTIRWGGEPGDWAVENQYTAPMVLDMTSEIGYYVMFFHGETKHQSGAPGGEDRARMGIAYAGEGADLTAPDSWVFLD